MQREVADAVAQGRKDLALGRLSSWKRESRKANEVMNAPEVSSQFAVADELEARVEAAFEGDGQQLKQKALGKSLDYDARDRRRVGSKKGN